MGSEQPTGMSEPEVDAAPTPPEDEVSSEPYASDPQSALDAIESVEQNAQSLIESAIDGLLEEDPIDERETDEEMSMEDIEALLAKNNAPHTPAENETAADDDSVEVQDESVLGDELSDEAIDAELDALESMMITPQAEQEETHAEPAEAFEESSPEDQTTPEDAADEDVLEGALDMIEGLVQETPTEITETEDQDVLGSGEPVADSAVEDASTLTNDDLLSEIASDLIGGTVDESETPDEFEVSDEATNTAELDTSDLDSIDEVLSTINDEVRESVDESEPEPTPAGESEASTNSALDEDAIDAASTLEDLDATLAGIGDDLLSGDFETPEGEMIDSSTLEQHDASALLDQLNIDGLDLDGADEEAKALAEQDEDEPTETLVDTPAVNTRPTPVPAAPVPAPHAVTHTAVLDEPEIPEAESIWQTGYRLCTQYSLLAWGAIKTHGAPLGARAVIMVNKPVKDRPAQLRDSIGYLALWTLLMATILWVYLVFVRATPIPTPTQAPTRVLQPGEVVDPLRTADSQP